MKNTPEWLSVSVEEYKAVRTECLTAIKMQYSTLSFGAVVIGILAAAAIDVWSRDQSNLLAGALFWIYIPLVGLLTTLIWAGELMRLARAHGFVKKIENRISKSMDEQPDALQYERWLDRIPGKEKIPRAQWNYWAVVVLFVVMSVGSWFVGNSIVWGQLGKEIVIPTNIILICAALKGTHLTRK